MRRHCLSGLVAASLLLCPLSALAEAPPAVPTAAAIPAGHKAMAHGYQIVWLQGTPYEMGYQHGQLLHEQLKKAHDTIQWHPLLRLMLAVAQAKGLTALARENCYPEMRQEIDGFLAATKDIGWTMDECLALNFGDMIVEFIRNGTPEAEKLEKITPGCSQFVAGGTATKDGRLYHGRLLDWDKIDFVVDNPTIFVRQPTGGIAHATIGFPGNLSPYSGINEAGLSTASNEADPFDHRTDRRQGHSHVQMQSQILSHCHSLAEARALIKGEQHMTCEIFTITDGNTGEASVFEMAPGHVGERKLTDGILYATNHFVAPETAPLDKEPVAPGSRKRFDRLGQLVTPGLPESQYGQLDPASMVAIMRDRKDPWTGKEMAPSSFDDNCSLATNGALYAILFDPAGRRFWVAMGKLPVPVQPFVGFSLTDLLAGPASLPAMPAALP
jgi:hypothetical protein